MGVTVPYPPGACSWPLRLFLGVTFTYSQNGSPIAFPINVGAYNVTATVNTVNYQGSATDVLVITKGTPTIFWNKGTYPFPACRVKA